MSGGVVVYLLLVRGLNELEQVLDKTPCVIEQSSHYCREGHGKKGGRGLVRLILHSKIVIETL